MATAISPPGINRQPLMYTGEQERAIGTRGVPIALSAGAGCGKTFVLTERFLSFLEPEDQKPPPCDLSQLIAITFTDRAAREMRDRIRAKCYARLREAPAETAGYWLRLYRSLDSAQVSTIHSFCGNLLRRFAVEAGIDPRFTVLEAAQAETLANELTDDLLRDKLSARDEGVLNWVMLFSLRRLREAIADLFDGMRAHDWTRWRNKSADEVIDVWRDFHARRVVPHLLEQLSDCDEAKQILATLEQCSFESATMRERQEVLLRLLPDLAASKNVAGDLAEIHEHAKVDKATAKDWPDKELKALYQAAAKKLREKCKRFEKRVEFDPDQARPSAELGLALLDLAAELDQRYRDKKRELALLDFDDLLLEARRLLADPRHERLHRQIGGETRALLVDECQDTDPVQVDVINALCGDPNNRFVVGDFKQSIYRFRGADPGVFLRLQAGTPQPGRMPLSQNFRSQPAILNFVNALFCREFENLREDAGGDGGRYKPLVPHREQTYAGPAIEFMWSVAETAENTPEDSSTEAADDLDSKSALALRRRDADCVARRICQLLDPAADAGVPRLQIIEKHAAAPRPVRMGDIAILFRALSNVSYYEEALRSYGIAYYLVGGHAFYSQQEVYDVLNLLRSLASPADEVALAGVLRSPFFSLTDESLFWLAQQPGGLAAGLFTHSPPSQLDARERQLVSAAAATLAHLRQIKDRLPIAALLIEALKRTGYDAALLAEFLGERKLANLRKLLDQARAFDRTGLLGLSGFIVQLSQFVARQPREGLAATHPESTDVVRLMTIHQAKGLEFPVVFVPDLARREKDGGSEACYSHELGPLVKLPSGHKCAQAPNGHGMHSIDRQAEDKAELVRLLYVAATRAADLLILSSGVKDLEKPSGVWMSRLASRFDLASGRLTGELPAGYPVPKVHVRLEPPETTVRPRSARSGVDLGRLIGEIQQAAEEEQPTPTAADAIPPNPRARRRFSISRLQPVFTADPGWHEAEDVVERSHGAARDAIDLGKLVHGVLATLDFHNAFDLPSRVLVNAEKLNVRDADVRALALALIERFVSSSRALDLRRAQAMHREVEFLLAWPPARSQANGRYLQGYLDCLYRDAAGRWHVLDYKTSQVSPRKVEILAAEHELQMLAYAAAAEQALGEPVADATLHFLRTGAEHVFVWDDSARSKAADLVTAAIDRQCTADSPSASAAPQTRPRPELIG